MILTEKTNKNIFNDCVHKRQMIYLFNGATIGSDFSKHFENCEICKEELKNLSNQSELVKLKIPEIHFDDDLKLSFNRELGELFKVLELDKKSKIQKKVKSSFKFIDQIGIDIINVVVSKKMIIFYSFAAIFYLSLRLNLINL